MKKKYLLILLLLSFSFALFAQKNVRKAIRSGNKAYKEQLYGAAEEEYTKATKENAGSKEASYNLANTYYKQQRWDDAIKEYQHYLTLENTDALKASAAYSNMGNTFLKKKGSEKGQMPVPKGQQPQQPQQQADNLQLSMQAYKQALRLNPNDNETRYNLAVVQKMIQDNESQDKNKDQKQDPNKDNKQDQNKDQNKDQQQKPNDQKQDQQQNQMSQDNMQQILQAIEQDEKATQEKVNQAKAQERQRKNENNRKQNKDW